VGALPARTGALASMLIPAVINKESADLGRMENST
jgi:hypothetical protein